MAGGAQAAEAAVLALLLVLAVGELGLPEVDEDGGGGCNTPLALSCATILGQPAGRRVIQE